MSDRSFQALRESLACSVGLHDDTAAERRIDVIVPVFNAVAETVACLESVARKTETPYRLIVINDGSPDPDVGKLLKTIEGISPHLVTIAHDENRGFVRTVNEGMRLSRTNDVVLLNSDARVTANWLGKLAQAARRPKVATVTPLTNNGTICSVPDVRGSKDLPDGYDLDEFAGLIEATTLRIYPEVPTGVGFCLFISRTALDRVGYFDEKAFPRGYGEENDFCQRAIRAGFTNLIADDTFVYHGGGASFGAQASTILERSLRTLVRRYPYYLRDVDRLSQDHPLRLYHEYLRKNIAASRTGSERIQTRALHALHYGSDSEQTARRLAGSVNDSSILSYVLLAVEGRFHVDEYFRGQILRSLEFGSESHKSGIVGGSAFEEMLETVCWALDINQVHSYGRSYQTRNLTPIIPDGEIGRDGVVRRAMQRAHSVKPQSTGRRLVVNGRRIIALMFARGALRVCRLAYAQLLGLAENQLRKTGNRVVRLGSVGRSNERK